MHDVLGIVGAVQDGKRISVDGIGRMTVQIAECGFVAFGNALNERRQLMPFVWLVFGFYGGIKNHRKHPFKSSH